MGNVIDSLYQPMKIEGANIDSPKSKKYIERIISKVIKNYRKHSNYEELFDFSFRQGEFNCNDIEGWGRLLVNRPIHERLNRKFERLMYNQKDDTS